MNSLSIIITAYRSQNYIQECLDSIMTQTFFYDFNDFEILLGIDGCQETLDKVNSIKSRYRNLKVYMMKENVGTYITKNTLLNIANNDFVIFFDSDDIMMPNMIEYIMTNKEDANIVQFGYWNFVNDILNEENINKKIIKMAVGVLGIDKSLIKFHGGFQPWRIGADTELFKRLSRRLKGIAFSIPLFYRRIHKNSLCALFPDGSKERTQVINKVSNINILTDPYIKMITTDYV